MYYPEVCLDLHCRRLFFCLSFNCFLNYNSSFRVFHQQFWVELYLNDIPDTEFIDFAIFAKRLHKRSSGLQNDISGSLQTVLCLILNRQSPWSEWQRLKTMLTSSQPLSQYPQTYPFIHVKLLLASSRAIFLVGSFTVATNKIYS